MREAACHGFFIAASILLLACPLLSSEAMTVSRSEPVSTAAHESTREILNISADGEDAVVDLYGNDVTDAVAEYTLDAAGSLYEVHSPQTELFHLASPKT